MLWLAAAKVNIISAGRLRLKSFDYCAVQNTGRPSNLDNRDERATTSGPRQTGPPINRRRVSSTAGSSSSQWIARIAATIVRRCPGGLLRRWQIIDDVERRLQRRRDGMRVELRCAAPNDGPHRLCISHAKCLPRSHRRVGCPSSSAQRWVPGLEKNLGF